MNWSCASCSLPAKTNRKKCSRCGSLLWRPAPKKDLMELAGPIKRIAPKGLLLAAPEKRASVEESRNIECGKCHAVIYTADHGFDTAAFLEAKKRHYLASPACEENK